MRFGVCRLRLRKGLHLMARYLLDIGIGVLALQLFDVGARIFLKPRAIVVRAQCTTQGCFSRRFGTDECNRGQHHFRYSS